MKNNRGDKYGKHDYLVEMNSMSGYERIDRH